MSDFQLKRKKLISQLSLTDVEFQSHTFATTKWIALYNNLSALKAAILQLQTKIRSINYNEGCIRKKIKYKQWRHLKTFTALYPDIGVKTT